MPSPIDLSERADLTALTQLLAAIRRVRPHRDLLLVGATARDVLLSYAHGIAIERATLDLDFAVAVASWDDYYQLRQDLLASGSFTEVHDAPHRLVLAPATKLDLIPFGGVERADRTIAWPPDGNAVMRLMGYREAMASSLPLLLPDGLEVNVVSLPSLAMLKLFAWRDRRMSSPGKDAADLWSILRNYLDAGNEDRLYTEAQHLFHEPNYDYLRAGAWLLGRDLREQLLRHDSRPSLAATLDLLSPEIDPDGNAQLGRDMRGVHAREALELLSALHAGLNGQPVP